MYRAMYCALQKEFVSRTNLRDAQQKLFSNTDPRHVLELCGVYDVYAWDRKEIQGIFHESYMVHETRIINENLQEAVHILCLNDIQCRGSRDWDVWVWASSDLARKAFASISAS